MSRKSWLLVVIAVVLAASYAYYFTDWINTPRIQVLKSDRIVAAPRAGRLTYPVVFSLDGRYELTSVKIAPVSGIASNMHVRPVWELAGHPRSVPTRGFIYGQRPEGMVSVPTNGRPQQLEPGITYHIHIQAGRAEGDLDFQPTAIPAQ